MSTSNSILVTGGYGCIGVQTVKWLLANSQGRVVLGSRDVSTERTVRYFTDDDRSRLCCLPLDVRDSAAIEKTLIEYEITHVVHLAALQTPDCLAHRDLGLQINLAGTQNLIEAIKVHRSTLQRFVFASSIAVYGPRSHYSTKIVPMLAEPAPVNVYGTWKLAGEHLSRLFCEETGIPTISIRPGVLFGPGRDAGLTASTTTAMKCVALEVPYEIPFRSRQDYLYSPDVGAAFGQATIAPFQGYGVFTLPSHTVDTLEIVKAMRLAAEELGMSDRFAITVGPKEVPFICDLDFQPFLQAFPKTPHTPLFQAVRESLETFRNHRLRGWLK
ncbi:MAG: NAD(P)-dependent oxidoreductase [Planctomycetes bacterium]|nr:NAD(P)-dependent oxidoreductase [Planctomycetota bacterium]